MAKTEPSLQTPSQLWTSIHWAVLIQSQGTSQVAHFRVGSVLFGGESNPRGPVRVRSRLALPSSAPPLGRGSPQQPKKLT